MIDVELRAGTVWEALPQCIIPERAAVQFADASDLFTADLLVKIVPTATIQQQKQQQH